MHLKFEERSRLYFHRRRHVCGAIVIWDYRFCAISSEDFILVYFVPELVGKLKCLNVIQSS